MVCYAPEEELIEVIRQETGLYCGIGMINMEIVCRKIVFIGRHLDKEELIRELDECLE